MTSTISVAHINFSDIGGGAEVFSTDLTSNQKGAKILVGKKSTDLDFVVEIPKSKLSNIIGLVDKALWKIGCRSTLRNLLGLQNYFHNSYNILSRMSEYRNADIIHLHNIHGEFFDLRAIEKIAKEKHLIWTSHDMWLVTGGEGFVYDNVPDHLRKSSYPLRKGSLFDSRKRELRIKKQFCNNNKCNILFIAPSKSHLKTLKRTHPRIKGQLIYNAVNLSLFRANRKEKGIPKKLLIFNTSNPYKNSQEVIDAIEKTSKNFHLHVLGNEVEGLTRNGIKITNHGQVSNRRKLSELFSSIDIAAFSSKAETFGLLPLELGVCGSIVLLNSSISVFHEHKDLYGALLYKDSTDLAKKIDSLICSNYEVEISDKLIAQLGLNRLRNEYDQAYSRLYHQL